MRARVGSIVMGASDVRRAMESWGRALGHVPREEPDDTWGVLTPGVRRWAQHLGRIVRDACTWDLYTSDQAGEVDRSLGLGASRVDWQDCPEDADFVVLADTEGNRFCVVAHG